MTETRPETPPRTTIVIAVLNAAADMSATLDSIAAQGEQDLEIVVMDGGSTDGTVEVARASRLPITLVSEPDRGVYDAMNKGAALARGRWLQFLNAGDVFTDDRALTTIDGALTRAEAADRTWLVAGARYVGGPTDGFIVPNLPHVWYRHALGLQAHCHQAIWFRSDLFRAIGGYSLDFDFVGDFDLIVRWGMTGAPEPEPSTVIDYARGGLSDRRESEIPALLRKVRRERLQLGGAAPALEAVIPLLRFSGRASRAVGRRVGARLPHLVRASTSRERPAASGD